MLDLKLFGDAGAMARVAARLDAITGTARVRVVGAARPGKAVVRADVAHGYVDDVLDELKRLAVPAADVSLARVELVGQLARRNADTSLAWADVLGVAGTNARIVGQYLVFMVVAGVIGCYASSIAIRCCSSARWRSALTFCRSRRSPSASSAATGGSPCARS